MPIFALRGAAPEESRIATTEILGSNTRWETMFAALLSLMLKKHLIADWEFVDEYRKI